MYWRSADQAAGNAEKHASPIEIRSWQWFSARRHRLLRAARQTLVSPGELSRLKRHAHAQAQRLAILLEDWRRRRPIEDPLIESIERQRTTWLQENTGGASRAFDDKHSLARACRASIRPIWAELLYRIARDTAPRVLLELGTNLGISSAYLAAGGRGHGSFVITLDGAPARLKLAQWLHRDLKLSGVAYRVGRFQQTLKPVLEERSPIDFAFIDGNHRRIPTLDYFDAIHPHLTDGALVIFDDIYWSGEMVDAGHTLCQDQRFAFMVDLAQMGIGVTRMQPADVGPRVFRIAGPSHWF